MKPAAILVMMLFSLRGLSAADKLNVVTTLPDLAYIAGEVGGEYVETHAIAKGYQDPHFVDAKPSFVLKLKDADVFVQVGLDLEVGWVPPLLETARNSKIYFGGPGYVDASRGVSLLEVPSVDPARMRAEGDIHVFGNPHYWLDPENGKVIAKNIADGLSSIMPTKRTEFADNADQFSARIDSALQVWQQIMAPHKGAKIVAYHNSWPYFEKRFGIEIIAFIEPKPGIPPPPSHLMSVIRMAQDQAVKAIIISPYFDDKPAKSIAKRSNAEVVYLSPSVGATNEVKTYFDLFQSNVTALAKALEK